MIEQLIEECRGLIPGTPGKELLFDTCITVKNTPHSEIMKIYGVKKDTDGIIHIKNDLGHWLILKPGQVYLDKVLYSLLQRLKLIFIKK